MKHDSSYPLIRLYHRIGFFVIAFLSAPLHFLYDWLGENPIVGSFVPVNESVWEHLKLALWPTLLWWLIGFFVFRKKRPLKQKVWIFASCFSVLLIPFIVVSFFYTMKTGLNLESLLLDILTLYLAIWTGQAAALHVYRYTNEPSLIWFTLLVSLTAIFTLSTIWFTFFPPNLPLFTSAS